MHFLLLWSGGQGTGITNLTGGDTGYTYAVDTATALSLVSSVPSSAPTFVAGVPSAEPSLVAGVPSSEPSLVSGPPSSDPSYVYGP